MLLVQAHGQRETALSESPGGSGSGLRRWGVALLLVLVFVATAGMFTLGGLRLSCANQTTRIPAFRRPVHVPARSRWFHAGGGALCPVIGVVASLAGLSVAAALSIVVATLLPALGIFVAHNRRVARAS